MDIEFSVRTIEIDEHLQDKIQEMLKEGWSLVSGTKPVAVYHLQRIKPESPLARYGAVLPQSFGAVTGAGGVGVNEDQVFILRNGRLLKPGEEGLPENQPK